jgi:Anti-sigma-K factor rskA
MSNDDRIAYLAGDDSASLTAAERAELDELRAVLTQGAVWVEPDEDLEEAVVAAIAGSGSSRRSRAVRHGVVRGVVGVAAAVLLAVGITVGLTLHHESRPIQYAASLNGTSLAPDAAGEVTLTRTPGGWKIHLHATGLPRRDNGAYYEAWLKDDAGVLVPVGTFNEPLDVVLWAGVSPTSHPGFTVTRQLANGDPASSAQVVLVGPTHRAD